MMSKSIEHHAADTSLPALGSRTRPLARIESHRPPLLPDDEATREWRVRRVRQALLAGTYDQEAALDGAMEKLAAELGVTLEP